MRSSREISIKKSVDWFSIGLYAVLVIMGVFCIYAARYNPQTESSILDLFDFNQRYGKQLLWVLLAGVIGICILFSDHRVYEYFSYYIYAALVLLLIATIFLSFAIKGSRSWLVLGPVSLQPAEFAKFATALALAKYMSGIGFRLAGIQSYLRVGLIIFIPFIIIILQNETGSALVYLAFMIVLFREGMSGVVLFLAFWAVLLFIIVIRLGNVPMEGDLGMLGTFVSYVAIIIMQFIFLFWYEKGYKNFKYLFWGNIALFTLIVIINSTGLLSIKYEYVGLAAIIVSAVMQIVFFFKYRRNHYLLVFLFLVASFGYTYSVDKIFDDVLQAHQRVRIEVTLGMKDDPKGVGYSVNQSKIAIGSGGLLGKGFLNGTQTKLRYVPEQDTDFIFCTVGEEFGFAGTFVVMLLFLLFILRLVFLAERQRTVFSRIYGYCVASILFFHVFINIGMVIGLTPVIGIPLPFFTYGGSSLWGFTVMIFIFLRLDMSRSERLE
ncbi:MAG: rod shape-determining protein RodA [Prevotellaceae bacterium]|jgi:rod shape determining protein RodA|nr:rod shape-determining protein RodA [Prevotellaceae bacterium]